MYLDTNNLYGWAMCAPLPIRSFKWNNHLLDEDDVREMKPKGKKGYILEVDLEYPQELHEKHNGYPLAPEKKAAENKWFSPYQKSLMERLGHNPPEKSLC